MAEILTKQNESQELPVLFAKDFNLDDTIEDTHPLVIGEGESWVIATTGIRGSGKSLLLALLIAHCLIKGLNVWSNMRVAFKCIYSDGSIKSLATKPLDFNLLYQLHKDLVNGIVVIDELQYYIDSRTSGALRNRLINSVIRQVRKRTLSFFYSTRDLGWIDKRLREWETDIEFKCWDCYKSNRDCFIKGDVIRIQAQDLSAAWTGIPYSIGADFELVKASRIWPIYVTSEIIDYFEASAPLHMDLQAQEITNRPSKLPEYREAVEDIVLGAKLAGRNEIPADEISTLLSRDYGLNMEERSLGRILKTLGVIRKRTRAGSFYNVEEYRPPDTESN